MESGCHIIILDRVWLLVNMYISFSHGKQASNKPNNNNIYFLAELLHIYIYIYIFIFYNFFSCLQKSSLDLYVVCRFLGIFVFFFWGGLKLKREIKAKSICIRLIGLHYTSCCLLGFLGFSFFFSTSIL